MADYRLPFTGEQVENILTNATPQSELTQETERAQGAEQTLQGNIDTEERDRKAADNQLQQNIDAEQQARIDDVDAEETRAKAAEKQNADDIDVIEGKIPAAASPSNQMADKAFVNSSIATATATYRGAYNLVSDLHLTISATEADVATALAASIQTADNNDYCFVQVPVANDNPTEIARVDRYKYNGTAWALEYTLNNSGYTASQWAALNSGITSGLVAKLNLLPTKAELDALLNAKAPQATTYTKSEVDALIANFITASVNNLVNYYLKSDTYTKAEVQQLIDAVKQFTYVSVAELPTASADTMNKIYLVPSTNPQTKNVKDEFITIANTDQGTTTYSWEQIGTTTIDLSGYYTSQQTDAAISNALAAYSTTTEMQTYVAGIIASYYTKTEVDTLLNTKAPQATTYTKSEVDAMVGDEETRAKAAEKANADDIDVIEGKIPAAASPSNQLADKAFVNSSIATATATYRGAYNLVSDLSLTVDATEQQIAAALASEIATADNNDYCFVQVPVATDTPTVIARVDRYKYNGTAWVLEYTLNNSGYTAAQWDALNSGITSGLVAKLIDLPTNAQLTGQLATKYEKPVGGIPDTDLSVALQTAIASFITASTQNLVYYYLKSETYSATEVDQLLAAIKQFTYEIVQTLPTASAQTVGKIYLVPSADPKTQNVKDEFITLTTIEEGTTTYSWECIGSTTIDLSNYYTKTQTDAAITAAINLALADYSTTTQVGTIVSTAITTALANYYTKTQVDNELAKKTDKLTMTGAGAAVEDDIMVIDENGNIKDGGKKISDLQLKVTDCAMLGGGFPTCTTAGGTAAKTVSISNFLLLPNCRISVLFQNAFTATNPTLSINSGAAIAIRHFGRAMEIGKVHANTILTMIYDGTYWQVVGIEGITGSTPSGAVDLALPSGLLWCEHNVGAASPYEDGLYFSWGNITGHTGTDGYDFGTSNDGPYASTPGAALTGNIPAGNDYDAARHNMGAPWRMPTVGEFQELNSNCDSIWTDEDGVAGRRFTSRINDNSIFFPASGNRYGTGLNDRGSYGIYWSSSLNSQTYGYNLYFYSTGVGPAYYYSRFRGFSVRAVQ